MFIRILSHFFFFLSFFHCCSFQGKPLLVIANKQDLPDELTASNELPTLNLIQQRGNAILRYCAIQCGKRSETALSWFSHNGWSIFEFESRSRYHNFTSSYLCSNSSFSLRLGSRRFVQ